MSDVECIPDERSQSGQFTGISVAVASACSQVFKRQTSADIMDGALVWIVGSPEAMWAAGECHSELRYSRQVEWNHCGKPPRLDNSGDIALCLRKTSEPAKKHSRLDDVRGRSQKDRAYVSLAMNSAAPALQIKASLSERSAATSISSPVSPDAVSRREK
jgi:hypothetical protein